MQESKRSSKQAFEQLAADGHLDMKCLLMLKEANALTLSQEDWLSIISVHNAYLHAQLKKSK